MNVSAKVILEMLGEIRRLPTNERYFALRDSVVAHVEGREETIDRLRAENETLRKDAERYRWLRDPCSGAERVFYCRGDYGKGLMSGPLLDEEIDAAMSGGRGE